MTHVRLSWNTENAPFYILNSVQTHYFPLGMFSVSFSSSTSPSFSQSPVFLSVFSVVLCCSLLSLVNTIAQAVSCCRHFVADHGAESLLPSNCQSVHFMVHIPRSPFVRVPLAPMLISLTPSLTNNNKSNTHLSPLTVKALLPFSVFELK